MLIDYLCKWILSPRSLNEVWHFGNYWLIELWVFALIYSCSGCELSLIPAHALISREFPKFPVHRGLIFPLCLRWDMRLGEAAGAAGLAVGWRPGLLFLAKLGKCGYNICQPLGRPRSGSELNLWAEGGRLADNSSTDEQRADLGTSEAEPCWFLPTCSTVSGIGAN